MSKASHNKKSNYFDYNLLILIVFLLCFGLVMLFSSSSYIAANKYGDSAYFLKMQMRNIGVGLLLMIPLIFIDYRVWKRFAILAYIGSFLLCCVVLVIGQSSHGSSRWLRIGPIQFQPSEVAKLGIIIAFAALIEKVPRQLAEFKTLLKMVGILVPIVIVVAANNLSTAIIIMGIGICMLFVASPKYSHFFVIIGSAAVAMIGAFGLLFSYRRTRIEAWLKPETAGEDGYQTLMGLYAIGSGGLFGKGLGKSLQKLGNVPESQNDMIFTIICEELGLFGATCVILLFILLLWRMMIIANNAPDLFGSLLVTGVMAHIAIQVILNIAVVTNTIPNTGVILPFISYGGTSLIFLMAEMGIVLSVSRRIKLESFDKQEKA